MCFNGIRNGTNIRKLKVEEFTPKKRRVITMALTRKFLSALGIEADKIDEIINAHSETVNGLKEQAEQYKEDADKLASVQKELNKLKETEGTDDYKKKYEDEHKAFEDYKAKIAQEEDTQRLRGAYKQLLLDSNIDESRIEAILKVTDFADLKLNKDGKLANEEKVKEKIDEDWKGFKKTESSQGSDVENPPSGSGPKTTKEEIMKIKDVSERQKAIAENHELFGY